MEYTVNQLYQHLFEKPLSIYDTFKGFFGEDFVDMQPKSSSSIKEYLFAKICDGDSNTKGNEEEDFNLPFEVSDEQFGELKDTLKNSFLLSIISLKNTLIAIALAIIIFSISIFLLPFTIFIIFTLSFSLIAFANAFFSWPGIQQYVIKN